MKHITDSNVAVGVATAVTIGNFDGIHLGHRQLIHEMKSAAAKKRLFSLVYTFSPHPLSVFQENIPFYLINSYAEKKILMEQIGLDYYVEQEFNRAFSQLPPGVFAQNILFERLNCKTLVVGETYRFGKNREGDITLLQALAEKNHVEVIVVPSVNIDGRRVSSSRIRQLIAKGDIEKANELLTVPLFFSGKVVQGKQLGRTLGFPTINLIPPPLKLLPPNGVYYTKTRYRGEEYYGITNVGINPTVNGKSKTIETYLFHFNDIIYGETVAVYFHGFCRKERKFDGVNALAAQLEQDKQSGMLFFNLQ